MFNFFRNNIKKLGWGIVIVFAGTMFTGSFLLSRSNESVSSSQSDQPAALATIGDIHVPYNRFNELNYQYMTQLMSQSQYRYPTPDQIAMAQLSAFEQAINFELFKIGANQENLTVNRLERNSYLQSIYENYQVKGKSELKKKLKENNIPYTLFKQRIEEDMLVQKLNARIANSIQVTDQDVEQYYTELIAYHILLPIKADLANETIQQATTIKSDIISGKQTFEDAVNQYSVDQVSKQNAGLLGPIRYDQVVKPFADAAFNLQEGELSDPIQTLYGIHIIKSGSRSVITDLDTLNYDDEKTKIKNMRQQRALQEYLASIINGKQVVINHPLIKGLQDLQQKKYNDATIEFKKLIADNPGSPIPHYFIAKSLLAANKIDAAKEQLMKGSVKNELAIDNKSPQIHIELAKVLLPSNKKEAINQLNKAYEYGINDLNTLESLVVELKKLNRKKELNRVTTQISNLTKKLNQETSNKSN